MNEQQLAIATLRFLETCDFKGRQKPVLDAVVAWLSTKAAPAPDATPEAPEPATKVAVATE